MTFFAFPGRSLVGLRAFAARSDGRLNPPPSSVSAPAASVSRRVRPSQHRRGLPRSLSMGRAPKRESPHVATRGLVAGGPSRLPHSSLRRQTHADDLLVVAEEGALVGERRVAPDYLAAERRAGRVEELRPAHL